MLCTSWRSWSPSQACRGAQCSHVCLTTIAQTGAQANTQAFAHSHGAVEGSSNQHRQGRCGPVDPVLHIVHPSTQLCATTLPPTSVKARMKQRSFSEKVCMLGGRKLRGASRPSAASRPCCSWRSRRAPARLRQPPASPTPPCPLQATETAWMNGRKRHCFLASPFLPAGPGGCRAGSSAVVKPWCCHYELVPQSPTCRSSAKPPICQPTNCPTSPSTISMACPSPS